MNEIKKSKFSIVKLIIENNELFMNEELAIIELLFKKYNLLNLTDYCKAKNITPQGVLKRKKNGKQQHIILNNNIFYFD